MINRVIFRVLLRIYIVIILLLSCNEKPTNPVSDNPYDTENSQTTGDPFQLRAEIFNGEVTLFWDNPETHGLKGFIIYRSEQEIRDYSKLAQVESADREYVDQTIQNGHIYWYRVSAIDNKGEESHFNNTAAVIIKTEPLIEINGGAGYTKSKEVNLTILANTATQMLLSNYQDTNDASWQEYTTNKTWSLEPGDGIRTVFLKVKYENGDESSLVSTHTTIDTIPPNIRLTVNPDSGITNETEFQFDPTASTDNFAVPDDIETRFDYEGDGNFDTSWNPLSVVNYIYDKGGGDKTVELELRDGAGWTVDTTMTLFVNTRPAATFSTLQDASNLLLYHFDASASSDYEDGINLEYRWDFDGDGNWDTDYISSTTAEYEYFSGGDYVPKISVRDQNMLKAEKSILINIFDGMVSDIDGNVYHAVKIGTQWWMAENLKVTRYRNGDPVPSVTEDMRWTDLSSGAYCVYDNNENNKEIYGLLYNWFAVNDNRGVAPEGWHIPTDTEWKELEMHLGMSQSEADGTDWRGTDEGGKLKDEGTVHWNSPNTGATNESGFSALPGGYRSYFTGTFNEVNSNASFWTSWEYNPSGAWSRKLGHNTSAIHRYNLIKNYGFSIRCVKD